MNQFSLLSLRKSHWIKIIQELNTSNQNKISVFEFIYISSITNQIEYFKYSFKVASSLINNTILLYGAYELSHNKLIVTIEKYNKEEYLHSFSHSMNTILCLNDECLDILTSDGIYLTFQDIFKSFTKIKNSYQCVLDYALYSSNVNHYLSFISESYDNSQEINKSIQDVKSELAIKNKNILKLTLTSLFTIPCNKNEIMHVYSVENHQRRTLTLQ